MATAAGHSPTKRYGKKEPRIDANGRESDHFFVSIRSLSAVALSITICFGKELAKADPIAIGYRLLAIGYRLSAIFSPAA
jgi:hypothetical protein